MLVLYILFQGIKEKVLRMEACAVLTVSTRGPLYYTHAPPFLLRGRRIKTALRQWHVHVHRLQCPVVVISHGFDSSPVPKQSQLSRVTPPTLARELSAPAHYCGLAYCHVFPSCNGSVSYLGCRSRPDG